MKSLIIFTILTAISICSCSKKNNSSNTPEQTPTTIASEATKKIPNTSTVIPPNNAVIEKGYKTKFTCSGFLNTNKKIS